MGFTCRAISGQVFVGDAQAMRGLAQDLGDLKGLRRWSRFGNFGHEVGRNGAIFDDLSVSISQL